MDNNTTIAVGASILAVITMAIWYYTWRSNRPRHIFNAWDFSVPSVQPHVLRTLSGTIKVPGPNGKKVPFTTMEGYSIPRRDGKGVVLNGDIHTGRLFRPTLDGMMEGIHPIFAEFALADGRVESVVRATTSGGITLKHILIGLAVVAGLVCVVIYQFSKGG